MSPAVAIDYVVHQAGYVATRPVNDNRGTTIAIIERARRIETTRSVRIQNAMIGEHRP